MNNLSKEESYLANTLRRLRVMLGFTQQNIADALNINRSTYTYYETGKTTPDVQTLAVLARMFEVPIEEFLESEQRTPMFFDPTRRPTKKVHEDPKSVSELSDKEKSLVAILRVAEHLDIDEVLEDLKRKTRK